jgi:hypothetical protein
MKTTTMMVKMDMAKEANMVIRSKEPDTQVVEDHHSKHLQKLQRAVAGTFLSDVLSLVPKKLLRLPRETFRSTTNDCS